MRFRCASVTATHVRKPHRSASTRQPQETATHEQQARVQQHASDATLAYFGSLLLHKPQPSPPPPSPQFRLLAEVPSIHAQPAARCDAAADWLPHRLHANTHMRHTVDQLSYGGQRQSHTYTYKYTHRHAHKTKETFKQHSSGHACSRLLRRETVQALMTGRQDSHNHAHTHIYTHTPSTSHTYLHPMYTFSPVP